MEELMLPAFNPHLKRVLKDFQSAAVRSLSGPSNYAPAWIEGASMNAADLNEYQKALLLTGGLKKEATAAGGQNKLPGRQTSSREGDAFFTPPPLPIQQMPPLFMPMDASKSEKSETILEGETIACFVVGGEKRLCLPQILNTVLREIELPQINAVCDELHIFCSRCNSDQLNILKMSGVLPWSAPSCGLITKTDSERLCNALLHSSLERSREPPSRNSFKVYHECFGKCKGIFSPELYTNPHAKCIECFDCHGMFSPQKFVCHSHKALENRTCHWGFDSANWRSYMLIAKDQEGKELAQSVLDSMKAKFDATNCYKRKKNVCDEEAEDGKKPCYEETAPLDMMHARQVSAFQPWAPSMKVLAKMAEARESMSEALPSNLHTGRPVLLNPERVVPHSESHRYERHFAPNVSLAPAPFQKPKVTELVIENVVQPEVDQRPQTPSSATLSTPLSEPFIDMSSDTEESLKSDMDAVPQPRDELHIAAASLREREVRLMREVLQDRSDETKVKDGLLREFLHLRRADDERLANLVKENKYLRQELETTRSVQREKCREASESKKVFLKEIERLRSDHKQQMRELIEQVQFFRIELDASRKARSLDIVKTKAKYKGQMMQLKAELHCFQQQQLIQQRQQQRHQQSPPGGDASIEGKHILVQRATAEQRPHERAQLSSGLAGECPHEGSAAGHREDGQKMDDSA